MANKLNSYGASLIFTSFSDFLLVYIKRKTALKEAIREYEKLNEKRLSHVGYWLHVKKLVQLGKLRTERHEQLFLLPSMDSLNINNASKEAIREDIKKSTIKPIHSMHRTLLSMPYKGEQPLEGATYTKPFGRYGTAIQAVFRTGQITIMAYKKTLNVWVHGAKGMRTPEQLLEAKVAGYRALREFAQKHNLALEGYLEKVLFSHHVVESDALNEVLKPLFEKYGIEIQDRLGSKICPSSHQGKIEHEGKGRPDRIVRGDKVASGLEYLTLDFPKDFEAFAKLVPEYSRQLALHLEVERRQLENLERQAASQEKQNKLLGELIKTLKGNSGKYG